MLEHMYFHNLLSENQFGFLPQHSACSQLLCVLNIWFRAFENNESTDIIYTDIAKTFDSVCHNKLITVLSAYGFRGKILTWIKSFLSNRLQYVSINNQCSTPLLVISGVPQGSILGPLLFVVYINDIVDITPLSNSHNGLYLYADDAKRFDIGSNFVNLQAAVDKLSTWLQKRLLDLAASKCDHLCVTHARLTAPDNSFYIGRHKIRNVSFVKDLGIFIGKDLKFSYHINCILRSASLCTYQILRSFSTKNVWILLQAFMCYVRPKLEYCTCVWNLYLKNDILLLESIQKRFTRDICIRCNIPFASYLDRLHILGIKSLEYRRVEFDLILMYKICYHLSDLHFDNYFVFRDAGYNLRHHSLSVQTLQQCKHNQYQHLFFNRIVNIWNRLPDDVVIASSLSFLSTISRTLICMLLLLSFFNCQCFLLCVFNVLCFIFRCSVFIFFLLIVSLFLTYQCDWVWTQSPLCCISK